MKIVGGNFLGIWLYLTRLSFLEILENAVSLTTWKFYSVENQTRILVQWKMPENFLFFLCLVPLHLKGHKLLPSWCNSILSITSFTAPFNNTRTLKLKSQPTNVFFATVNEMFGGSSQLPTAAEGAVTKSLCTIQATKQCSAVVVSWEEPLNIWLTAVKNAFVSRPLNFSVRMLLKSVVKRKWKFHWSNQ